MNVKCVTDWDMSEHPLQNKEWERVRKLIEKTVHPVTWLLWLQDIKLAGQHNNFLVLETHPKKKTWVKRIYGRLINDTVRHNTSYNGTLFK